MGLCGGGEKIPENATPVVIWAGESTPGSWGKQVDNTNADANENHNDEVADYRGALKIQGGKDARARFELSFKEMNAAGKKIWMEVVLNGPDEGASYAEIHFQMETVWKGTLGPGQPIQFIKEIN